MLIRKNLLATASLSAMWGSTAQPLHCWLLDERVSLALPGFFVFSLQRVLMEGTPFFSAYPKALPRRFHHFFCVYFVTCP